jgi:hypothetical protein
MLILEVVGIIWSIEVTGGRLDLRGHKGFKGHEFLGGHGEREFSEVIAKNCLLSTDDWTYLRILYRPSMPYAYIFGQDGEAFIFRI